MKRLTRKFFEQPTLEVAESLLGKYLVRQIDPSTSLKVGLITETEAYIGEDDLACHASRGRTPRTEVMYAEAGHAYIYLIYGMHYMFNIVTEGKDFPAAVLIRAAKPIINLKNKTESLELIDGPGKITKCLKINKSLNKEDLITSEKLWLEDSSASFRIDTTSIKKSPRVGIDYAKHCRKYLWRFTLLNPRFARSAKRPVYRQAGRI